MRCVSDGKVSLSGLIPIRLPVYTSGYPREWVCSVALLLPPVVGLIAHAGNRVGHGCPAKADRCRPGYPAEGWVAHLECKLVLGAAPADAPCVGGRQSGSISPAICTLVHLDLRKDDAGKLFKLDKPKQITFTYRASHQKGKRFSQPGLCARFEHSFRPANPCHEVTALNLSTVSSKFLRMTSIFSTFVSRVAFSAGTSPRTLPGSQSSKGPPLRNGRKGLPRQSDLVPRVRHTSMNLTIVDRIPESYR